MRRLVIFGLSVCAFGTLALRAELSLLASGASDATSTPAARQLEDLKAGGRASLPVARRPIAGGVIQPPVAKPHFPLRYDDLHPVPDSPFGGLIHSTARRHDLNPELVRAMVRCESGFDPEAVSVQGARGLLQLMPETGARFGVDAEDLADPARNLEAGARYLSWLARRFDGDLENVLAAFNSGEGTVDRFQGVPPYRETRAYLSRVYRELGLGQPTT